MYWASPEVQTFFERLDGYALLVVLGNNLGLLIYASSGGSSGRAGDVRWGVLLTLMLAAAQYLLRLLRADVCRKHRHSLAVGNRLVRLILHMTAALQQSFNVMGAKFLQEEHSLVAVLARRLGFGPLIQLQISFNFSLPVRTAVLLQPLCAAAAAVMGYNAPRMLGAVPGMMQLAGQLCMLLSAWHELVLFVLTLGGTPPPGHDSSCRGPMVFNQLLVFINLLVDA
ncbi:hypothetical protein OEZ85_007618 [Tetradesmus obliquus]|uniref:ABC transmembrane type-1 domain-containing protein n=1 Tax=Tetradesmus obliquus TaxID=3088 RepID=A0ABY8TGY8_TETOB|nr:hypothetical protein OEZ85_007618 [Tetradesmus obliquus]